MRKQKIRLGMLLLMVVVSFTLLFSMTLVAESQEMVEPNQTEETEERSEEDKMLDEMEKIVDDFIAILHAAQTGDVEAMTRQAHVAQQFAEMMQKVALAEDEGILTEAQIERGKQIAQKIQDAMK
ncbi:MAG: hypothetical protein FWG98_06395 [Candidatus Cloacimonetes bacterium]|nr:hypothetical protein [Candidatus Cloacimonadota bacterium]